MDHYLKTWPDVFSDTMHGYKKFDLRVNDRGFARGDMLILQEYDPETNQYSGRTLMRQVGYMLEGGRFGLPKNMIIMSLVMV